MTLLIISASGTYLPVNTTRKKNCCEGGERVFRLKIIVASTQPIAL